MKKLIDKEALLLALRKKRYSKQSLDLIESQPVVDAIPIEWIMWDWRRNQPDDTQEDAWMRLGVQKMLADWEKENEKSN